MVMLVTGGGALHVALADIQNNNQLNQIHQANVWALKELKSRKKNFFELRLCARDGYLSIASDQ